MTGAVDEYYLKQTCMTVQEPTVGGQMTLVKLSAKCGAVYFHKALSFALWKLAQWLHVQR